MVRRHEAKSVTFRNIKARGDVAIQAGYGYRDGQGMSWRSKLDTVELMTGQDIEAARTAEAIAKKLDEHAALIRAISDVLADGPMKRTERMQAAREITGDSKKATLRVLDEHAGHSYHAGHRWRVTHGDRNARVYSAIDRPQ